MTEAEKVKQLRSACKTRRQNGDLGFPFTEAQFDQAYMHIAPWRDAIPLGALKDHASTLYNKLKSELAAKDEAFIEIECKGGLYNYGTLKVCAFDSDIYGTWQDYRYAFFMWGGY